MLDTQLEREFMAQQNKRRELERRIQRQADFACFALAVVILASWFIGGR
jgi:hypothetical protein